MKTKDVNNKDLPKAEL